MPVEASGRLLLAVFLAILGAGVGVWVYRDARARGRGELSAWVGAVVGGLILAGSVPGLVALTASGDVAAQGFPTALRIVPGLVALVVYLRFR